MEEVKVQKEREIQRQWEEDRIMRAKYNRRYKEIRRIEEKVEYVKKENLGKEWKGDGIRALIKLRCRNLEEENKYLLEDKQNSCIQWGGKDCMEHYMEEYKVASEC